MTPFRFYYAFDIVPSYWSELKKFLENGRIVLLDVVKSEIEKGQDVLTKWLTEINKLVVIPKITDETVKSYQEVMQYVATCGLYKESAFRNWAPGDVADPWLIASAISNGFTIVTQEIGSGGLSRKTPNRVAKIPDVARQFGVCTINLFDMMRKLGIFI